MVRNRFSLLTVKMNRRVNNKVADQGSNHRERAVGEPLATMRLNGDPNHVNAAGDHDGQAVEVVLVLVLFAIGLFECITLWFPKHSPIFCAFIACGSICTSFNVYGIQTRRITAAVGEARRATRLEVLIYLYCLALVITSDIDVVWVAIEQHGVQKFTYCPLTVIGSLIGNLHVDLLGECLHF
ncbi:hypothetical protein OROGR_003509 [Orobanche gracilis]